MELDSVCEFLRSHGFDVPAKLLIPDGNVKRFPHNGSKDAGWLYLHQIRPLSGEPFFVCTVGCHKTKAQATYCTAKNLSVGEERMLNVRLRESAEAARRDRLELNAETARRANWLWSQADPMPTRPTPYMIDRLMPEYYGCSVTEDGQTLIVPQRDINAKIWGLQYIAPDRRKTFMRGSKQAGCMHIVGPSAYMNRCYIAEGIATAASIYQATGVPTVACFSASNLPKVAEALLALYGGPKYLAITVCGDDDRFTAGGNAGREMAKLATDITRGFAIFPKFPDDDGKPTDFNDLHRLCGLQAVREQLAYY